MKINKANIFIFLNLMLLLTILPSISVYAFQTAGRIYVRIDLGSPDELEDFV